MNTPYGTPLPQQSDEGNVTLQMTAFQHKNDEDTPSNVISIDADDETNSSNNITPGNIADEYMLGDDEFVVEDDDDDVHIPNVNPVTTNGNSFFMGETAEMLEGGTLNADQIDSTIDNDFMMPGSAEHDQFGQEMNNNMLRNELLMDDVINDMNQTPQ